MSIESIDFNLKKSIENIRDMFQDRVDEKGIKLEIDYGNIQNFNFIGDPLRISQIIINLVSNAIKFTEVGMVKIILEDIGNQKIVFKVKDSGIGLKEEQLASLFEEFTQADMDTSRKYGGTGLGLAISKNLSRMMYGDIHVESEYGVGSSFIVELPLEVSENSDENLVDNKLDFKSMEDKVNKFENINILVAEDNAMNQTLLVLLLEDSKLNLDFAANGSIAVDKFKDNSYDLVLMDIQMPVMNGYEATKLIREDSYPSRGNREIPIVGLSANAMQEDVQKAIDAGMNSYIAKPIDVEKLYIELLKYLD